MALCRNFNTSYVVIKPILTTNQKRIVADFNTSYVVIKLSNASNVIETIVFQYILCCY